MTGLTYNLDVYVGAVRHVLNLDRQRVLSGVAPLRRADEEDGVHFTGMSSHRFVLQGNAIFGPGHDGARFTLESEPWKDVKVKTEMFQRKEPLNKICESVL